MAKVVEVRCKRAPGMWRAKKYWPSHQVTVRQLSDDDAAAVMAEPAFVVKELKDFPGFFDENGTLIDEDGNPLEGNPVKPKAEPAKKAGEHAKDADEPESEKHVVSGHSKHPKHK